MMAFKRILVSMAWLKLLSLFFVLLVAACGGGSGGGSGGGAPTGGSGNLATDAVSAALAYRAQAPVLDGLMKELGLDGSSLGTLVKAAAEDPTGDAAKALSELDFDDVAIEPEGLDVQGEDPES